MELIEDLVDKEFNNLVFFANSFLFYMEVGKKGFTAMLIPIEDFPETNRMSDKQLIIKYKKWQCVIFH